MARSVIAVTVLCMCAVAFTLFGPSFWPPVEEPPPEGNTPMERAEALLVCLPIRYQALDDPRLGAYPTPEEAVRGLLGSPLWGPQFEPATVVPLDASFGSGAFEARNEHGLIVAVVWVTALPGQTPLFTAGESLSCSDLTISQPNAEPARVFSTTIGVPLWGFAVWGLLLAGAVIAWGRLLHDAGLVPWAHLGDNATPTWTTQERAWATHRSRRAQGVALASIMLIAGGCGAIWHSAPDPNSSSAGWTAGGLVGHVVVGDRNVSLVSLIPLLVPLLTWLWVSRVGSPAPSAQGHHLTTPLRDLTYAWMVPAVSMAVTAVVIDVVTGGGEFQQWAIPYPHGERLVNAWWVIEAVGLSGWWMGAGRIAMHTARGRRAAETPSTVDIQPAESLHREQPEAAGLYTKALHVQTAIVAASLVVLAVLNIAEGAGGWVIDGPPNWVAHLLFASVLLSPAATWLAVTAMTGEAMSGSIRRHARRLRSLTDWLAIPVTILGVVAIVAAIRRIPASDSPWQYVKDFDADLTFTAIVGVVAVADALAAFAWRRRVLAMRHEAILEGLPHGNR